MTAPPWSAAEALATSRPDMDASRACYAAEGGAKLTCGPCDPSNGDLWLEKPISAHARRI